MASQDKPLISIAIPTYNHEQYLPICIDACWFQDYPNLEIVVVNANSPDNTREVLAQYEQDIEREEVSFASYYDEENKRVERTYHSRFHAAGRPVLRDSAENSAEPARKRSFKFIHLDEDPGLSETYNAAVRASSGEFVTTIVSDDVPHPKMISRLFEVMTKENADFVYSDVFLVDDAGRILREFNFPDYDPNACLADWYLLGNSKLWRRNLHEKAGWFDTAYPMTQDYELFFRFAQEGAKIVHTPEVLYSVRFHGEERKTGNHTAEREPKIFTESAEIALRAREWLRSGA